MDTKPSVEMRTSQPRDWVFCWKKMAEAEGKTLSEWVGERCNAGLPDIMRKQLSKRPPAHRPKKQAGSE